MIFLEMDSSMEKKEEEIKNMLKNIPSINFDLLSESGKTEVLWISALMEKDPYFLNLLILFSVVFRYCASVSHTKLDAFAILFRDLLGKQIGENK